MAYSEKAKALRRCTATRQDGEPCRAYARWGTLLCAAHTYKTRGRRERRWETIKVKTLCHCRAYNWPHRVGGGLCCWPDEPETICIIPASTHTWWRRWRENAYYRALEEGRAAVQRPTIIFRY